MQQQLSRWWSHRWARRLAWVVAGILLIWALGWALVPPLLKSQAQKALSEALGRSVSIGRVDFKPWTLELSVEDLSVAAVGAPPAGQPALLIKRFYLDAELESLLRLAPVLDAVRVDGLSLRLAHVGEGRYDFDDIVKRLLPADGRPAANPARFALYNLELRDASISFEDRPVGRVHEVAQLQFSLPFLSNLPSQREIKVHPRLAFNLNGSDFDSSAEGTPFAQSRKTDLAIQLKALDLAPYLAYWPATAPVKLRSAVLDADLRLAFEQAQGTSLAVSGKLRAGGVKLDDYKARELFALESISVELDNARPLERDLRIASVELAAPQLSLRRDASGRVDLLPVAPAATVAAVPEPNPPAADGWKVTLGRVTLRSGQASWQDDSVQPAARAGVRDVALEIKDIRWPFLPSDQGGKGAAIEASLALLGVKPAGAKSGPDKGGGRIAFQGQASDVQAELTVKADGVDLGLAAPYLKQFLLPELAGHMAAEADLSWGASRQQILLKRLILGELVLQEDRKSLASLARLEATGAKVDLAARSLTVSRLSLEKPKAAVSRNKDGRWMFEAWTPAQVAGTGAPGSVQPAAPRPVDPAPAPVQPAWGVAITEVNLADGAMSFRDEFAPKPVAAEVTALKLQMRNLLPMAGPAPAPAAGTMTAPASKVARPADVVLSARLAHGTTEPGTLSYKGTLSFEPLAARGALDIARFPLHAFEAYAGDRLNIELLRADASFKGDIDYAAAAAGGPTGMRLKLKGDTALEEVRAMGLPAGPGAGQDPRPAAEELLNWKVLSLRGLDVALAPGSPLSVDVAQTVLSDFYARVIIDAQGNINLQSLLKADAPSGGADLPAAAVSAPVASAVAAAPAPAASSAPALAAGSGAARARVTFGPISMVNGRVQFSDRFIRPNYSAALSELTGRLSAFSSTSAQMADLDLRGKAEGTASLEISGKLNPLAQPLALDIKAKVRDLELSPMTPYSVKYAGYGIQRGKLSVDLAYLVLPNGELTATNKLVLNQLTFGDKVDGAPNSLPVKLAVALLADRNGVIDIDLPISGSLNDPQFRLGPIIVKVILNLIGRAITAPFSLLASLFGGASDELSQVGFEPGSARLSPKAQQGLDKVAKALADRPGLKLTVEGGARLEQEGDALRRERLGAMLVAEKRRQLVLAGAALPAPTDAPLEVSAAEYPALLSQVYRRSEVPKPLDDAGQIKELPPPEMEALLLSTISIDEAAIRELAQRRGVVVRDYLATKELAQERLSLGPGKISGAEANWSPRADLVLATP
jgi:uncharacterized protein involved in outer membrane biogenesis